MNMTQQEAIAEFQNETKIAEDFLNIFVPTTPHRAETERKIARNKLAISALEAQTPRVLDFNEIKGDLPHHLWIECTEPETLYPAIARECITIDGNDWMMFSEDGFGGDYGVRKLYRKTWRCWTHKPTSELMAATAWGTDGRKEREE